MSANSDRRRARKTSGDVLLHLAARHQDGQWAMLYLADKASFSVNMNKLSAAKVNVFWVNPITGEVDARWAGIEHGREVVHDARRLGRCAADAGGGGSRCGSGELILHGPWKPRNWPLGSLTVRSLRNSMAVSANNRFPLLFVRFPRWQRKQHRRNVPPGRPWSSLLPRQKRPSPERKETEAKPEERIAAKAVRDAVAVADALSSEGVVRSIGELKSTIARTLTQLSDRLEEEIGKYSQIRRAIAAKDSELKEIYEIQRSASTLLAFLETHQRKQEEMQREFRDGEGAVGAARSRPLGPNGRRRRKQHEQEVKERDAAEQKRRQREAGGVQVQFRPRTAACRRSVGRRTGQGPKGVVGTEDATGARMERAGEGAGRARAGIGGATRPRRGLCARNWRRRPSGRRPTPPRRLRAAAPGGRRNCSAANWKGRRTCWPRKSPPWSAPCKSKPSSLPGSNSRPKRPMPRCRKSPCGRSKARPARSNWPIFSNCSRNKSARAARPSDDGARMAGPRREYRSLHNPAI